MMGKHSPNETVKYAKILLFIVSIVFFASNAQANKNSGNNKYAESSLLEVLNNLSEPQPSSSPEYPTNIMSAFGWAQHENKNFIRDNSALSYSFTVEPDTAIIDFNVILNWQSKSADLDIKFGRWDTDRNFISLRKSIGNTENTESIYIPRLAPGTYSILVSNGGNKNRKLTDLIINKRRTPFDIKWIGKSIQIRALNIRAKLEGPYDSETGLMNDTLRSLGLIPANEPYFLMGWGGDGETIDVNDPNGVLSVTGDDAIVDWIKVQLYDFTLEGYGYVDSRSALLQRDGDIVDINGGPVQFWNVPPGNEPYYVAIQHRNHSTIITDLPHYIGSREPLLDFTLASTLLFEDSRNPSRKLQNDEWLIWSGDVIRNGAIDEADSAAALDAHGQTGYLFEDVNLDGTCDIDDSNIILINQGRWDWG